jgi:hypothetical protein
VGKRARPSERHAHGRQEEKGRVKRDGQCAVMVAAPKLIV